MRFRGTWGAALAIVLLAGCLNGATPLVDEDEAPAPRAKASPEEVAGRVSELAQYELKEIVPFAVMTPDGIALRGHVYIPDAPEPLATVLEYSPYFDGQTAPTDGRATTVDGRQTMTGGHRPLLEAGFAIALVNIRGTGTSGNCVQWGTDLDQGDVALVVETLAEQPWSNGRVGMVGTSYPGWTQFMAMAAAPPSLKAVIPVSGVIDLYSLLGRNGASLSIAPIVTTQWHTLYSVGEATYPPSDSRGGEINRGDCPSRIAEDLRESLMLYAEGDRNAYWDARDLRPLLAQSTVPILTTNGFTDGEGHIHQLDGLWDLLPHDNKRMMIGQWGHGGTNHPTMDWADVRVAWFDHWLRDGPNLIEPGVVEYQDNRGNWHEADRWPPAYDAVPVHLSGGALVADAGSVAASTQTFQSVHANPCPGLCTDGLVSTPHVPVPVCEATQAIYVSPPLAEDVLLAGHFHVNITLTSTLPNGHIAVYLYRTSGDGSCPDSSLEEVRRALASLRHAQTPGGNDGEDFPINTPTEVNLFSHYFAAPVSAGERLVLAVGGGSMELTPDPRKPVLTVTTGPDVLGQVTLPVVEGTLRFE